MSRLLHRIASDLLHLFYPHHCTGCGTDVLSDEQFLCARCLHRLPATGFFEHRGNPVEKIFYGRLDIVAAGAACYFTKGSLVQHLLTELKYRGNREAGFFLGRLMGHALRDQAAFEDVDALIPLPLNSRKESARGYNQAALLCKGMAEVWERPVWSNCIARTRFTHTQTKQNRIGRWQNMQEVFELQEPGKIAGRHLLLVDDVITTGATMEACGSRFCSIPGTRLSIAAAAYTV